MRGAGRGRSTGLGLGLAVLLAGCPAKEGGPTEVAASPEPTPGVEASEPSPAGEANGGGGLAASVKEEVDEAREDGPPPSAEAPVVEPGEPLVAVVGGVPIPKRAFDEVYFLKVKKYADRGRTIPESADRRYRKSIVERLIHQERVRQEVVKLGLDYDPADLARRQEQQRRGIEDWAKHLDRRGETDASLRAMNIAELREAVILEARGRLRVSRAEIEEDYEKIKGNWVSDKVRVRAAQILVPLGREPRVPVTAADEAAAEAEAERIHALVVAPGADFAELAREHSSGPGSSKGGDLGIITADRMAEEFSAVAFAMKVGEISEPVKTKFGFHIIKINGRWPAGTLPIEALEDQITERLLQRKLHQGRRELEEELALSYPATHHLLTPEELSARRSRGGEGAPPETEHDG